MLSVECWKLNLFPAPSVAQRNMIRVISAIRGCLFPFSPTKIIRVIPVIRG